MVSKLYFLEGQRFGLRALRRSDISGNYGNWLNDAVVCRYNVHHRRPCTAEILEDYIKMIENNPSVLVLAIEEKETGTHIGNISLQSIDPLSQCAEFAILIGEQSYWHQGVGKETGVLLIKHGFQEMNLHRIYLGTSIHNIGMQKLAAALGFKKEGLRREAIYKNGAFHDIIEYGLLRSDWLDDRTLLRQYGIMDKDEA